MRKPRETNPKDPICTEVCSVTMFGMELRVHQDGRDRGLWFWLVDESEGRTEQAREVFQGAQRYVYDQFGKNNLTFAENAAIASTALGLVKPFLRGGVREAALLEWPQVENLIQVLAGQLPSFGKKRTSK